ncbi:MAG: hypothetical protein Nk1A_5100 [Endomicrobiia bacterium]|nr:MAG: hypothetical protein Nk1A_5100 [Endomicrobiia bacterium]
MCANKVACYKSERFEDFKGVIIITIGYEIQFIMFVMTLLPLLFSSTLFNPTPNNREEI